MTGILCTLAGSGFYDLESLTVGSTSDKVNTYYGYSDGVYLLTAFGSISDGILLGNDINAMYHADATQFVILSLDGSVANEGWTKVNINGTEFNRADATYADNTTYTTWTWGGIASNPFGTSGTIDVVFT